MKKIILITGLLIGSFRLAAQQDAHFSQYIFNLIYVNPAYAGYKEEWYLQSFYRSQWSAVPGAPQSFSAAADGTVNHDNVGLALLLSHDKIGAQSNLAGYVNYAYRIQTGDSESSRLAFGLGVGCVQLGIDGDKLNAVDAGDAYVPAGKQSTLLPDARAGIFYSDEHAFAGFSADNLLTGYMAKNKDHTLITAIPKPHFYLAGGAVFPVSDGVKLKPTFLLKDDLAGPTNLDINGFVLLNERLWIGGFYRTAVKLYPKNNLQPDLHQPSAAGIIAEIFATPSIRIGYAFDYSLNKLRDYNYGSHEFSLGFYLHKDKRGELRCYF
ncbi:type IX secretion system membrane protein PorP/SprF [Pedobacter sp. BS3]|uniref:PorP/SprF family type IX secretion system membrane protein n=1 Tax=Pedobacter sp. BS3 TaxID=2567937 RepID=UPI0011EE10CD|nr:type IX secretion system membrane protein PorP/SprF [Pedobacter sp. BS3]TZF82056.1 type IX secretion system membrane protein PorP/SprF [Pedobacter sp. BS3]